MKAKKIAWGYISEFLAAALIYALLLLTLEQEKILSAVSSDAINIATLFAAIMLTSALSFLWALYSKSDTPFSNWLHSKGAYLVYLSSFIYSSAVFAALIPLLIAANKIKHPALLHTATWLTIYGAIVSITFIKNVYLNIKLNMDFNRLKNQ